MAIAKGLSKLARKGAKWLEGAGDMSEPRGAGKFRAGQ